MDQDNIDKLNNLNDAFTATDLAEGVIKDKVLGQKLGTTATGRFGVLAAGFGISEQLAIWNKSEKSFEDFERLSIGLGTNIPSPLSLMLVPKKAFDDNFDNGPKEAENLKGLLALSKRLDGMLKFADKLNIQPIEDKARTIEVPTEHIANRGSKVEAMVLLSESQILANVKSGLSPDGKEPMGVWIQDAHNQGHSWYRNKDGTVQRVALTIFENGNSLLVTDYPKGSTTPKQEQHTIRGGNGEIVADLMVKPNASGQMEGKLIHAIEHSLPEENTLPKPGVSQLGESLNQVSDGKWFLNLGQMAATSAVALKIAQDVPEKHRDDLQKILDVQIVKYNLNVELNQAAVASVSALA